MATPADLSPALAPGGATAPAGRAGVRVASALRSMRDGEPCGDAAACHRLAPEGPDGAPGCLLAIVDGLGHGAEAAAAAEAALRVLAQAPTLGLPELLSRLDEQLTSTRGAAIGLVRIDGGGLQQAGVGNTRAMRWRGGRLTRLSSQNGIVGGGLPAPVRVTRLDLQAGDWLLLFSDGLDEMLQLPVLLPEWARDPAMLCEHLLQRWRVGRDDAGVLVCQIGARDAAA